MDGQQSRICVIGTGYVGVATAIGLAKMGHLVRGYDIIEERIHALAQGMPPYHEAGLTEGLREQLAAGRLEFVEHLSDAARDAAFIIVCVSTPALADGSADLSAIENVVAQLARMQLSRSTVVIRSTVPCGTTERIARILSGSAKVLYAPEFLREGHALGDFLRPDRVVIGSDGDDSALEYALLFASLGAPIFTTTYRDAELIKGCSNAFLAMKVSFANEVANLCDGLDADALAVLRGVGADRRIGAQFMQPGIGFGGPCFEKDLKSLKRQADVAGSTSELVSATLRVNDRQPRRIVDMLEAEMGGGLNGVSVAVWGLTFKAGTDDVRDSLAVRVIEDLNRRGAHVTAHDPSVADVSPMVPCKVVGSPLEALSHSEALLVLTEWPEFREVKASDIALRVKVVIDGRNVLDGEALRGAGIRYWGIGRRARSAATMADADAQPYAVAVGWL
jgi:UDPglucose 6-dehydrogenase